MTQPPSLPRRTWSTTQRLAVALTAIFALLVLVPVGIWTIINVSGERAWRAYAKEAEARGVALSMNGLIPPPVPDDENFALAPVFAGLFATDRDPDPSRFKLPDGFPTSTNRVTDFAALRDALVSNGVLAAAGSNPVADVRGELATYDNAVEELREAAKRSGCRWPVDWEKAYAALFPHATELLKAARLMRVRVSVSLAEGDTRAALADLRLTHRVQQSLKDEPSLIVGLVRAAVMKLEVSGIAEGLARRCWSDAELIALDELLRDLRVTEAAVTVLRGERAIINDTVDGLAQKRSSLGELTGASDNRSLRLYPTGWMRSDQVFMNEAFDDMTTAIEVEAGTFGPGTSIDARMEALSRSHGRLTHLLAMVLMPAIDSALQTFGRTAAQVEFARVAIALERYRLAHGAFPEKLADLGPMPADFARNPDGGGVLSYRREADGGYLLWATGPLSGGTAAGPEGVDDRRRAEWRWAMPGPHDAEAHQGKP